MEYWNFKRNVSVKFTHFIQLTQISFVHVNLDFAHIWYNQLKTMIILPLTFPFLDSNHRLNLTLLSMQWQNSISICDFKINTRSRILIQHLFELKLYIECWRKFKSKIYQQQQQQYQWQNKRVSEFLISRYNNMHRISFNCHINHHKIQWANLITISELGLLLG